MPMPDLQPVAADLYALLEPIAGDDSRYDYALAKAVQAWSLPLEEPAAIAADPTVLLDIDRTPDKAINWLGQFVGVVPRIDLAPAEARNRVKETDGWLRGSRPAIIGAAKQYLTGQKRVSVHERDTSVDHLSIVTYTSETPDEASVRAALEEQIPWGLQWTYQVLPGQSFRDLRDNYTSFRAARDAFPTFRAMRDNQPGA